MSLFSKKIDQEIGLVLDVGNGSVAGALVLFKTNNPPQVIYSKREPINIALSIDQKQLPAMVLSALEQVVQFASTEGLEKVRSLNIADKKVRHTYCTLASPWCVSKTKTLVIENDTPTIVTKKTIDSLLQKEETLFEKEISQTKNDTISQKDIEIIERMLVDTKLNGYSTSNPHQKKAKSMELTVFITLASQKIIRSIEGVIGKFFNAKNINFHSYNFVQYHVIGDIFSNESNFLSVDISAEVTDISLVKNNTMLENISFPLGRNHTIRTVAKEFGVTPDIALSFVKMHTNGDADEAQSQKIAVAFEDAKKEWAMYFSNSIADIIKIHAPSKIFVTVDDDVSALYVEYIKNAISLSQNSAESFDIPIVILDEKSISQFVAFDVHTKKDPFIALESIFFDKIFNKKSL